MDANITLILILSFLIWGSPFIARFLRMPIPPVEIMLGAIFAYIGFIEHNEYFNLIANVGFLYLLFLAGMEVDLKQITKGPKEVIQKSSISFTHDPIFNLKWSHIWPSYYCYHLYATYFHRSFGIFI